MCQSMTEEERTAQQRVRMLRALDEMDGYEWTTEDGVEFVYNPLTGQRYAIGEDWCSCPDFINRCHSAGLRCKHLVSRTFRLNKIASELAKYGPDPFEETEQSVVTQDARRAFYSSSVNLDF